MRTMFSMGFQARVASWSLGQTDPKLVAAVDAARNQLAGIRTWQTQMAINDTSILSVDVDARFKELDRIVTMDAAAVGYIYDKVMAGELVDLEQANDAREWAAQVGEMYKIMISTTGMVPSKLDPVQVRSSTGTWYTAPGTPTSVPVTVASSPTSTLPSKNPGITGKDVLIGSGVAVGLGALLYALLG